MFRPIVSCYLLAVLGGGLAWGHIVPPEKLHPVAAAYRRANFVLNLNPVPWALVADDAAAVADYWRAMDAESATVFLNQVNEVINEANKEPDERTGTEPMPRREAASKVFVLLTKAVNSIGQGQLDAFTAKLKDRKAALYAMREAEGILGAFDDAIKASDADGFARVGQSWLQMSSALGSAGLLGHGAVEANQSVLQDAVKSIASYMDRNFGAGFEPVKGRKLVPWPAASPSFNVRAKLPVKLPPGANINKQLPRPRQLLNMASRGADESETTLIALGDMAFDSPFIFGDPARSLGLSCNTCHNKSITNPDFFIPGLSSRPGGMDVSNSFFAPHANNGLYDPLDTPDLRGIRFTAPYGRNGRFTSLTEFVRNVITNEFNGPEPDPILLDGIIAYMFEFDFLSNPDLNKDGRLNASASAGALRGEKIFHRPLTQMGGMSCATCHIPSANFLDHKQHDIGAVHGFEDFSKDRAMDTPTLLGIKYTPPYFHDGSQPTLRGVVDWFNEQFALGLAEGELRDLTAYVETVGSGVDAYEDTMYTLDAELEEFSFFLSAFEFLDQRNKRDLISMTFQTIVAELRAHKWDLRDYRHMPVLDELADLMERADEANRDGDFKKVAELVESYRQIYEKYKDVLI